MLQTVLSEVTPEELTRLKLGRKHKPIEQHYGIFLRGERILKKIHIDDLKSELKKQGIDKTRHTIMRWERGFSNPSIDVISVWTDCLGLKMSVFVDCYDRRLVKGSWLEKLKILRKDCDINMDTVSRKIGVMAWTLSQWEQGKKAPNESELKDWAAALGATACLVFERKDTKK
jgi:transcriptional regulator with XRE-family HTH domain